MRIGFVYDAPYPWHVGGIEAVNYEEVNELAKRHEVHFFTTKWPGMPSEEFVHRGVTYHARRNIEKGKLYRHNRRSIREAVLFSLGLFRMFRYDFDVVVGNFFPIVHLPVLWLYCKVKGARLVLEVAEVWERDYWISYLGWPMGELANAYSTRVLNLGEAYVCNSSITARKLAARGVPPGKIRVFAPCIDGAELGAVRERGDGRRRKRIIFSGRFIREKRIDKWLRVVKGVSERVPGVEAVLIGGGPELGSIREGVRSMGLSRTVRIRPFYKDKISLYREIKDSSLMLHMSEREGFGIVCVESVALGTPVVLPSYTPIPREVRDMCVVGDEGDLPGVIARMLGSGDKPRFIRNRGNLDRFLISKVNDFYGSLFRSLGLKEK